MDLFPVKLLCLLNLSSEFEETINRAQCAGAIQILPEISSEHVATAAYFKYTDNREVLQIKSIAIRIPVSLEVHNTFASP